MIGSSKTDLPFCSASRNAARDAISKASAEESTSWYLPSTSETLTSTTGKPATTPEPNEQGKGYEFINGVVGGSVPREYVPAVDKGIREAVETGVIAGYPVVDVKVTLFDGSYHDVDSNEMAFKIAGSIGFKEGFRRAKPVLLEPIMKVEVVTPEEYSGDVIGDLNRRRGQITGMDETPAGKAITADVPLSEMFGYATTVRSMSQGRATFTMEFAKYVEVPPNIADGIIKK